MPSYHLEYMYIYACCTELMHHCPHITMILVISHLNRSASAPQISLERLMNRSWITYYTCLQKVNAPLAGPHEYLVPSTHYCLTVN